jgi:hypothetical protein
MKIKDILFKILQWVLILLATLLIILYFRNTLISDPDRRLHFWSWAC